MKNNKSERIARELLCSAGIAVGSDNPWDIRVHNKKSYKRYLCEGALGLGESYMDGWWDCDALDEFIAKLVSANIEEKAKGNWKIALHVLKGRFFNLQTKTRAYEVGKRHYDIGNDLYKAMLDERMLYTCGYWKEANTLAQAQEAKLELVCKKIGLRPGMKVLELGCGWGSFAKYAAEKYGAHVTGITVSKEQVELGTQMCKGLPVDLRLEDYRGVEGKYDAIISIGILEHVGYKNYRTYMETVDRCLKDDGIAFIHTIGANACSTIVNAWFDKYIFPNSMLPSIAQIGKAMNKLFVMEDWHNFGPDYDKTLMAWYHNFERAWPQLKHRYDERFYRMWRFYLLSCAGAFRSRRQQLWQIVMTKTGRAQPNCRVS
ncbi:MAG: cyclopropane fatty acyl phospholipid synthase [Pseudomonadota bacterium]